MEAGQALELDDMYDFTSFKQGGQQNLPGPGSDTLTCGLGANQTEPDHGKEEMRPHFGGITDVQITEETQIEETARAADDTAEKTKEAEANKQEAAKQKLPETTLEQEAAKQKLPGAVARRQRKRAGKARSNEQQGEHSKAWMVSLL